MLTQRSRATAVLACVFALVLTVPAHASDRAGTATGTTTPDSDDDGFSAEAHVPGVVYTTGGRSGPQCSWDRLTRGDWERIQGTPPAEPPQYDDSPDSELEPEEVERRQQEQAEWQRQEEQRRAQPAVSTRNGVDLYSYGVKCPGRTGNIRFTPVNVDVDDLIPGAYEVATGRIETPIPDVSPKFEYTGYVNLGMWLALEPTTIEPVTAEAGPNTWITITPTHDSITFDFDNGDTQSCNGFGIPIVDLETFDEGPCGYTYQQSSPDDDPYMVEVGTTWNLPFTSSDRNGALPAFTRTDVFAHNVDELQTIGRSN